MDTLIRNGRIITADGDFEGSIAVRDGLIEGVYRRGDGPSEAREVIDATGLAVLPGVIDMHSHHREGSQPGFEYKDTIFTSTQQCAAGGVTTSVAMPNVNPPPNSVDLLKRQFAIYERDAIVDWNFNPAPTIKEEIPALANQGIAAFKIFMVVDTGRNYPHMPGIGVHDHGRILEIMQDCARANVPLMVHPHDQALMDVIEQEYWARGERDALAYAKAYAAHDGVIWETAIATLLRLQQAAGCHLHILHTQTAGSVQLIREAKARGQKVTCEINPWALFLGCDWSAIQRLGSYALSYWVPEKNVPDLWQGLNDGTIDIVATDHAPHLAEEKEVGWTDGWKAHTGTPSTQFYVSMLLDAAAEGKISLNRVVEACSTRPASLFGIQDKGRLQAGFHADIVLADLGLEYEIRDEDVLSLIGWSPYAGRKVKGKPVRTIVRGRTVFQDGKVVGEKGFGKQAVARYPQLILHRHEAAMWQSFYDYLNQDTRGAAIGRLLISILLVLAVWQLLTSTIVQNRMLLAPPLDVFEAFGRELRSGAMWRNAVATVTAVGASFPVAVAIGVLTGLMLASNRVISLMVGPLLSALNSVPIIALAPLFIAWLGLGLTSKFVLVLLVAVFPVIVTTEAGLRAADKNLIEAAHSFNATPLQVFTTVTFPYALPFIVSGVRVAWARALVGIVVAEFFGSFAGFGFAVMAAGQTFDTATLLTYVIVLGAMGLVGSMIFQSLEERLAPWRTA